MVFSGAVREMEGDKRDREQIPLTFDQWHDPSIPPSKRTMIMKLFVDTIFFGDVPEEMRRSTAWKLYHVCKAFREWPVIHRILAHTIEDPMSNGIRDGRHDGDLFPHLILHRHHWWWAHRQNTFNEALRVMFDLHTYSPGSWREDEITQFRDSPFRFTRVNSVILRRVVGGGRDAYFFWEAPDGPSMILFTYTVLRYSTLDFVVIYNLDTITDGQEDRVIFHMSWQRGFLYWYQEDDDWDMSVVFRALFRDSEEAYETFMEAWGQDLSFLGKLERFVDRWYTRTPRKAIAPRE